MLTNVMIGCLLVGLASLDDWRAPTGDWFVAGEASLDPQDPAKLASTPGAGVMINGRAGRTGNILSVAEHGDCEAHIEFMVPRGSNSGVYFMARYEIQVLDSWESAANKPRANPQSSDCGGIYERWKDNHGYEGHPPRVNAAKAPGQWQSFDVIFRAPRFDAAGKKVANAKFVRVVHNGVVIHENQEVTGPTRAATYEDERDEKPAGPLMLQGDHGPVAYRNIRLRAIKAPEDAVPESAYAAIAAHEYGASRKELAALEEALRGAPPDTLAFVESKLVAVLGSPQTTSAGKDYVCRLLRQIGTAQAVPALAALLPDPKLSHMARFALQHLPDPAADAALRAALGTLSGNLKIGVVGSLGERGSRPAVADLAPLVSSADTALAAAALRALGRIGGAEAAAVLTTATVAPALRDVWKDALLGCGIRRE
jgi:hypothetical protein